VPVEVLAGPVVPHGRAGIGMPAGDLDIAQVRPGIETGRDEGVPEHMRVRPGDPHARMLGKVTQAAGDCVPVHPGAAGVEQDLSADPVDDGAVVDGRPTAGGSGTRTTLVPLPQTRRMRWPCSSPRSAMSARVAWKIRRSNGASMATRAKSLAVRGPASGGQQRLELRVSEPERG
jgi:hypothetical protein